MPTRARFTPPVRSQATHTAPHRSNSRQLAGCARNVRFREQCCDRDSRGSSPEVGELWKAVVVWVRSLTLRRGRSRVIRTSWGLPSLQTEPRGEQTDRRAGESDEQPRGGGACLLAFGSLAPLVLAFRWCVWPRLACNRESDCASPANGEPRRLVTASAVMSAACCAGRECTAWRAGPTVVAVNVLSPLLASRLSASGRCNCGQRLDLAASCSTRDGWAGMEYAGERCRHAKLTHSPVSPLGLAAAACNCVPAGGTNLAPLRTGHAARQRAASAFFFKKKAP